MNPKYGKGFFLIANPVLPDPNFSRTVVLLCNHNDEGSFGLVVNRSTKLSTSDILGGNQPLPRSWENRVFIGGPVSQSQVFYLCHAYEPLPEMETICEGVQLGMNWEALEPVLSRLKNPERDIRFYLGYSGWAPGQLAGEMEQKSWLTCEAKGRFVFGEREDAIWAGVVSSLGKDYQYLLHAPVNPSMN
jgi:putative transcriptional regulator